MYKDIYWFFCLKQKKKKKGGREGKKQAKHPSLGKCLISDISMVQRRQETQFPSLSQEDP